MIQSIIGLSISVITLINTNYSGLATTPVLKQEQKQPAKELVYTSDWEPATLWNRVTSEGNKTVVFTHQHSLPKINADLLNTGLVLVFTKGYTLQQNVTKEKPMGLPFTFFTSDMSTTEPFNWYQNIKQDAVELQLAMPKSSEKTFLESRDGLRFRYFILSPQFFKDTNLTQAQVKALSYKNLVALLHTTE